jgi:mono/diheme cytochrome c family protein
MNNFKLHKLWMPATLTLIALGLTACNQESAADKAAVISPAEVNLDAKAKTQRWYTLDQANQGKEIFAQYCADCHGSKAESIPNWKQVDALGNYPPPPLDGSAHAWHHPLAVLDHVIVNGGAQVGGVMPGWGEVLSFEQRMSVIASFQSYWSDEIYDMWLTRERSSRSSN